jgi:hypothetical protein
VILDPLAKRMRDVGCAWNGEWGAWLGLLGYPRRFIVWIRSFGGCADTAFILHVLFNLLPNVVIRSVELHYLVSVDAFRLGTKFTSVAVLTLNWLSTCTNTGSSITCQI